MRSQQLVALLQRLAEHRLGVVQRSAHRCVLGTLSREEERDSGPTPLGVAANRYTGRRAVRQKLVEPVDHLLTAAARHGQTMIVMAPVKRGGVTELADRGAILIGTAKQIAIRTCERLERSW